MLGQNRMSVWDKNRYMEFYCLQKNLCRVATVGLPWPLALLPVAGSCGFPTVWSGGSEVALSQPPVVKEAGKGEVLRTYHPALTRILWHTGL